MKITIEHEGTKATVEDNDIVDITQAFQLVKQALLGIGFHPDNINDCLEEELR